MEGRGGRFKGFIVAINWNLARQDRINFFDVTIFYSACNNTVIELFWRDESRPRISKKFIFHRIGRWTRFRAIFFFFQFFAIHGWDTGMTNDNSLSRAINMIYRVKLKFRFESRLIWILRVFFFFDLFSKLRRRALKL